MQEEEWVSEDAVVLYRTEWKPLYYYTLLLMFKAPIRTPLYVNKVLIYKGVSTSVDMKNLCIYKLYIIYLKEDLWPYETGQGRMKRMVNLKK